MSGGHWNYEEHQRREWFTQASDLLALFPDLEHELDWGLSGDTCIDCARVTVARVIEVYLDTKDLHVAQAAARGGFKCFRDRMRDMGHHGNGHGTDVECKICVAVAVWEANRG